ncbi:MAG: hypothetical protein ACLRQF_18340 [Thomasclavelia ramosa]
MMLNLENKMLDPNGELVKAAKVTEFALVKIRHKTVLFFIKM